jgi:hypothetical protein
MMLWSCASDGVRRSSGPVVHPDCLKIKVNPPFRGDAGNCEITSNTFDDGGGIAEPLKASPGSVQLNFQNTRYSRLTAQRRTDREFSLLQMQATGDWGFAIKPPLDRAKGAFGPSA